VSLDSAGVPAKWHAILSNGQCRVHDVKTTDDRRQMDNRNLFFILRDAF